MSKTITRSDLSEAVHRQIGLSQNESAQLVASVLDEVSGCLEKGETVKLSSFWYFFGSFQAGGGLAATLKQGLRQQSRRDGVLSFRPSNLMKKRINTG